MGHHVVWIRVFGRFLGQPRRGMDGNDLGQLIVIIYFLQLQFLYLCDGLILGQGG
jgi:hypothetical protein